MQNPFMKMPIRLIQVLKIRISPHQLAGMPHTVCAMEKVKLNFTYSSVKIRGIHEQRNKL